MKSEQIRNLVAAILPNASIVEDSCENHGFFEVNYNGRFGIVYLNPNGSLHFDSSIKEYAYGELPAKVSFEELESALKELSETKCVN
jgi:hypothetical protein